MTTLHKILFFLFGVPNRDYIDKPAFWTFLIGVLAIGVAYSQLSSIKKTSKADFLKKFNDNFFTPETRNLITLLLNQAIEFYECPIYDEKGEKSDRLPAFRIIAHVRDQLENAGLIKLENWRKGYTAFEVDDLLLGHFDDVGRFEKKGLIDMGTAYHTFGYYFHELVENEGPVKAMLEHEDNEGNYEHLEYINRKFKSYAKRLKN